jgi:hypothetical protein
MAVTPRRVVPGTRVTWFADEDYWGTVTAREGDHITVDWDEGPVEVVDLGQVTYRHNMAVPR